MVDERWRDGVEREAQDAVLVFLLVCRSVWGLVFSGLLALARINMRVLCVMSEVVEGVQDTGTVQRHEHR